MKCFKSQVWQEKAYPFITFPSANHHRPTDHSAPT